MAMRDVRTILLTGASGVVGQALLRRLSGCRVVCLTHDAEVAGFECVGGDLLQSRLGLDAARWDGLADRLDAVIHAGAVTDFSRPAELIRATNVDGTRRVLELAARAGAPVYYVSTAFVESRKRVTIDSPGLRYAESKAEAEDVVRGSGLPHVIVRPSIVLGSSSTGEISSFQGLYYVADALLRGLALVMPFGADWRVDFVALDVVVDVVARLVEQDVRAGEWWATAGPRALTVRETVDGIRATAVRFGRGEVPSPRYVAPEMYARLIAPVFIPALPSSMRRTVTRLFDFILPYVTGSEPYPCSMPELEAALGVPASPGPQVVLERSLDYWATHTGYARRRPRRAAVASRADGEPGDER